VQYLVNYGLGGFLGRFRSDAAFARDDRVVVRSPRGLEPGTVLAEATDRAAGPVEAGEIVRALSGEDSARLERDRQAVERLLAAAQAGADARDLPLTFLDGEILLDGTEAILQAVHWGDCDATPLFESLSAAHGLTVKLADLTTEPKPAATGGCGTCGSEGGGCSSCGTGGGCSTGSCSKGSVKTAEDMTAYFAGLRRQMEASAGRVPLQ
jgi:hypothetical protein